MSFLSKLLESERASVVARALENVQYRHEGEKFDWASLQSEQEKLAKDFWEQKQQESSTCTYSNCTINSVGDGVGSVSGGAVVMTNGKQDDNEPPKLLDEGQRPSKRKRVDFSPETDFVELTLEKALLKAKKDKARYRKQRNDLRKNINRLEKDMDRLRRQRNEAYEKEKRVRKELKRLRRKYKED